MDIPLGAVTVPAVLEAWIGRGGGSGGGEGRLGAPLVGDEPGKYVPRGRLSDTGKRLTKAKSQSVQGLGGDP